jgi:hypothetical protein
LNNVADAIVLTLVRLGLHRLLVPEDGLRGQVHRVDVQQRPGVDDELAQRALDRQLLEAVVELLPVLQQDGVELGHLGRRGAAEVHGRLQEALLAVDEGVRPRHVHQLVVQQLLHVVQGLLHL